MHAAFTILKICFLVELAHNMPYIADIRGPTPRPAQIVPSTACFIGCCRQSRKHIFQSACCIGWACCWHRSKLVKATRRTDQVPSRARGPYPNRHPTLGCLTTGFKESRVSSIFSYEFGRSTVYPATARTRQPILPLLEREQASLTPRTEKMLACGQIRSVFAGGRPARRRAHTPCVQRPTLARSDAYLSTPTTMGGGNGGSRRRPASAGSGGGGDGGDSNQVNILKQSCAGVCFPTPCRRPLPLAVMCCIYANFASFMTRPARCLPAAGWARQAGCGWLRSQLGYNPVYHAVRVFATTVRLLGRLHARSTRGALLEACYGRLSSGRH